MQDEQLTVVDLGFCLSGSEEVLQISGVEHVDGEPPMVGSLDSPDHLL